jgi:hypothetical protein
VGHLCDFYNQAETSAARLLAGSAVAKTRIPADFRVKSFMGFSGAGTDVATSRHADINIFTVASGLLYERFASIMILSVMKHTKSTVKFWFIVSGGV